MRRGERCLALRRRHGRRWRRAPAARPQAGVVLQYLVVELGERADDVEALAVDLAHLLQRRIGHVSNH